MTERQLVRAMAIGALKLRLNAAVRWSACALLLVSFVAATGVLATRLWPEWGPMLLTCGWCLPVLVVALAATGFRSGRLGTREVAIRLDRTAGLQEHLTTWDENRSRPLPEDSVSCSFISLQRSATLRAAVGLRPWRLLPLVLPGWTRLLWLGLMALGCATLMPEQRPEARRVLGARSDRDMGVLRDAGASRRLAANEPKDTFRRIGILSPSEMQMLRAVAFGPDVPEELKEMALRNLEAKVGPLNEADLSPEVRDLLAKLRPKAGGDETAASADGSAPANGQEPGHGDPRAVVDVAPNPLGPHQAVQVARSHFADVADALQRYYMGDSQQPDNKGKGGRRR